jgi:Rad3-related DNA helicase
MQNFPFQKPRDEQVVAIDTALDAFNNGKRFVIIEAGTGVGKSAIAVTTAREIEENINPGNYTPGSYFITTQKLLQKQYVNDFGGSIKPVLNLMGSVNYTCANNNKINCSEGLRALKTMPKSDPRFIKCARNCVYKNAKESFIRGRFGVTNFSYFLAETNYAGKLEPRQLLVIDEAHNIEDELSKFIEVSINENFADKVLNIKFPELGTQFKAHKWIQDVYLPKLSSYYKHMEKMIEKLIGDASKLAQFEKVAKQFDLVDKHLCKINRFLEVYNKENWVFNDVPEDNRSRRKLEFKPIDISVFSESFLFNRGEKVLLMSATILNKSAFCESLGIKEEDCEFIHIASPFPVENHPINIIPVGSMGSRSIDQTLPNLVYVIKEILKEHKGQKGIIHAHTYKIAKYIKNNVKGYKILLHDSSNREEMLERHINSKEPTILLSPSMAEGVDLKDDSSRFQIICKIPYPFLGDKLVKKRMNKWKWWYPLQTAKKIVQSVGRSIRNESDYADTYILDADWIKFFSRNKSLFPPEFKNSIRES